jgi:endonuclease/exonuclease/phosphatase family metal-dependent hydrolase
MRIATWNIYWLGDRTGTKWVRTKDDEQLIAEVIKKVSPDVLALEEIVDPIAMDRILKLADGDGRHYVIRSDQGAWLTSDADPANEKNKLQKAFLCINNDTIEVLHGAAICGGPEKGRKPYAAALRHRSSQKEFVAVAVHLRSGYPDFMGEADAKNRRQEAKALSDWLQGAASSQNPDFPEPDSSEVVVLGDFNAELEDPNDSLDPLALAGWTWRNPDPDGDHWETAIYENDRYVIDFIMLSPAMTVRMQSPPRLYAWDYDPVFGGPAKFHYGSGGSGNLKGYGVSDHRPVVAVLDY